MKKNNISPEEVKHIAKLAKLELNQDDLNKFQKQLSDILDFVDKLSEMKTTNVEPTSQVTGLKNIFRQDIITPSLSQKEALANAPRQHQGHFVVKAIFG